MEKRFQSTLPTRGSDSDIVNLSLTLVISIHAPHEGERLDELQDVDTEREISIHAPHEGERPLFSLIERMDGIFQSTLPTRGSDLSLI